MKKFFVLFVSMIVFTACSDDDDSGVEGENDIVGRWYLAEVNNSGSLDYEVNDCTSQSYIDFMANNTADSMFYSEVEGECVASEDSGTWEKASGDSRYTFLLPFAEELGPLTGEVRFNEEMDRFTFYPDFFTSLGTNIVFEKPRPL
ncbi:lipocalin family protein [Zunongwangia sp. F363]|uniref:Lipocalin family protein n=1 Tax=Autumnicola tepida TaxID=3075595 RepID=A0ABU3CB32_9FLAO|nr:lipocalin family protein [Zunongwangia sp. F363]MDT0643539.1 lipocalin family protein [Zunongwangia sp. F363]